MINNIDQSSLEVIQNEYKAKSEFKSEIEEVLEQEN